MVFGAKDVAGRRGARFKDFSREFLRVAEVESYQSSSPGFIGSLSSLGIAYHWNNNNNKRPVSEYSDISSNERYFHLC